MMHMTAIIIDGLIKNVRQNNFLLVAQPISVRDLAGWDNSIRYFSLSDDFSYIKRLILGELSVKVSYQVQ